MRRSISDRRRSWSKIVIFAQSGSPSRNIARTFGVEKLEWCGYPTVKKLKIHLFVLTEYTNVMDGRTDGHRTTAGRAYASIARQKNVERLWIWRQGFRMIWIHERVFTWMHDEVQINCRERASYININTKNLRSVIIVKGHCSMTHLKQQKSVGFFLSCTGRCM